MSFKIPSFNSIANVLASLSAVGLAGIIGTGTYVYVNRQAIIDEVKEQAIEAVLGGGFGGAGLGGDLPVGAPDLANPSFGPDQAAMPSQDPQMAPMAPPQTDTF